MCCNPSPQISPHDNFLSHQLLCHSRVGSTRQRRTRLSSPPLETGWHFSGSAAGWAPGPERLPPWRGPDPGGSGWPSGRRAGSRRHYWAQRWWWTSFLRLWTLTTWPQRNAWFRPLMHRSSSSSGPPVWAFGTFGLQRREYTVFETTHTDKTKFKLMF